MPIEPEHEPSSQNPEDRTSWDPSRRSFIQAGAGVVVGAAALIGANRQLRLLRGGPGLTAAEPAAPEPTYADVELRVNGEPRSLRVPHQRTLLLALREDLFVPPAEDITVMHRVSRGEILSAITLPLRAGTRSTFIKYSMRNAWDFAIASVGAALRVEAGIARGARIVLGGVAPIPWRSLDAEREVEGRALDRTTIESAAQAAIAGARPLAHNEYKVALVKQLVRSALLELAE
jgi:xanthine dehydrogenase YagS FAD-binding subunit